MHVLTNLMFLHTQYLYDLVNVATAQPDYEELLLNAVATTTNIGFYACKEVNTSSLNFLRSSIVL